MILTTERLILRPWKTEDALWLYELAKDPRIGPLAGWPVHTDIEYSRKIINEVLIARESYAVTLKENNKLVGSISMQFKETSNLIIEDKEAELGYWLGVPYWGQGLIPEAAREVLRHGFEDLKLETIWCACFEGNKKSQRVMEKCGFMYKHSFEKNWPPDNCRKKIDVFYLTYEHWQELRSAN